MIEELKVKNIILSKQAKETTPYEKLIELVKQKNVNVIVVKKGDRILIEKNLYFDILWPQNKLIHENILNNNSIVAKLQCNNFSALFTGDIEKIAEEEILEQYKNTNMLQADILKVGHHRFKNIFHTKMD